MVTNSAQLKQIIHTYFSLEELYSLCLEIEIAYEDFPNRGKDSFCRDLVEYVQRHGKDDALLKALISKRPSINWLDYFQSSPKMSGQEKQRTIPLLSTNDIPTPYGTMPPNSTLYIERDADFDCWGHLKADSATTIAVRAPRQMGKSSLMRRIAYHMKQEHRVSTVFIDLDLFSQGDFEDEERFLTQLCILIGRTLRVPEAIDRYWNDKRLSNTIKCSDYISEHIVPKYGKHFILALDEVERLFRTTWHNDFFGMLRAWHNDRFEIPAFDMVTIFLSSSTEPYLFINNPDQSPFNVAHPVLLTEFSLEQVSNLNWLHGFPLKEKELERLYELIGGHPFLNRLVFYSLVKNQLTAVDLFDIDLMLVYPPIEEGLRRYWGILSKDSSLKASLARICVEGSHQEDQLFYRLEGAGLVKKSGSKIVISNTLYEHYFRERLHD
jgi:hypothetical protein